MHSSEHKCRHEDIRGDYHTSLESKPQQENPDCNPTFLQRGQLTSERELEKIQGDSRENFYQKGSHRVFRTPASKRDDKQFILGVYKIMSGLKDLDRN